MWVLLAWVLLCGGQRSAEAAIITVTSLADNTATDLQVTLREAILAANTDSSVDGSTSGNGPDDIVFLAPGTIVLNGTQLPTIVDDLTIFGLGAEQQIIDGNDQSRLLEIDSGVLVELTELTLTNGRSEGANGGGILNNGQLTVGESILSNNETFNNGGGIHNTGSLTVRGSKLLANSANNGGGIFSDAGSTELFDTALVGNFTFDGGGGGILNISGTLTVTNSTLSGNFASNGGGIVNTVGSTLMVTNSTLSGNEAGAKGGGISNLSSMQTVTNSTITANRANPTDGTFGNGGGIETGACCGLPSPPVTLNNTIVAGNFKGSGTTAVDIFGSVDTASSFNLIGVDTGLTGISDGIGGNQIGMPATPIDPLLGILQDNGGLTFTHALLAGSPAIDQVGPCSLPTDQRGAGRMAPCDSGAFEAIGCSLLEIESQIIDTAQAFSTCNTALLGPDVIVEAPNGNLTVVCWLPRHYQELVLGGCGGRSCHWNRSLAPALVRVSSRARSSPSSSRPPALTTSAVAPAPNRAPFDDAMCEIVEDLKPEVASKPNSA